MVKLGMACAAMLKADSERWHTLPQAGVYVGLNLTVSIALTFI